MERSCSISADRLWNAETTGTPGTRPAAACAAEPSHTPNIRVGRPPMVAAKGTLASTRIAFFSAGLMLFRIPACAENGTASTTMVADPAA